MLSVNLVTNFRLNRLWTGSPASNKKGLKQDHNWSFQAFLLFLLGKECLSGEWPQWSPNASFIYCGTLSLPVQYQALGTTLLDSSFMIRLEFIRFQFLERVGERAKKIWDLSLGDAIDMSLHYSFSGSLPWWSGKDIVLQDTSLILGLLPASLHIVPDTTQHLKRLRNWAVRHSFCTPCYPQDAGEECRLWSLTDLGSRASSATYKPCDPAQVS